MIPKEYSCLEYWRNLYRNTTPKMEFNALSFEEYQIWRESFYSKYIECLGRFPKADVPLEPKIVEEREYERYIRKKVVYNADTYSKIPAYLFIPKESDHTLPAVLCPHGHGRGKTDPAGITNEKWERDHVTGYNYDYALQFALRGYVALAPDLRCFGERGDDPESVYGFMEIEEGQHWCDINFIRGILLGFNLLTLHVFDMGRGIDFLRTLPEVDGSRIGCVGLSQGGTTTLFTAAYDKRIKVAGISGYLNSWKSFPLPSGQICGSQVVPGLLEFGDHPDVAGLIAPRPLFLEFGIKDPLFPIEASRDTYQKVRTIYRVAGAEEKIECEEFDGPHEFHGNKIFDFFKKWL